MEWEGPEGCPTVQWRLWGAARPASQVVSNVAGRWPAPGL